MGPLAKLKQHNAAFHQGLHCLLYPLFSLEKKGIIVLCQSRTVVRLSVRPSRFL